MELRASPLVPDYTGPVLFDAPAAGSVLAQALAPSLSGARPPLSMGSSFDAVMERFGGRSEWSGRVGTRVLPANVTLIDDPTLKDFQGKVLLGNYAVDDEGVPAERVTLVDNGTLRNLLMSRRPGPDFQKSNGHARSANLSDTMPLPSNLIFQSSDALDADALKKKFLDACQTRWPRMVPGNKAHGQSRAFFHPPGRFQRFHRIHCRRAFEWRAHAADRLSSVCCRWSRRNGSRGPYRRADACAPCEISSAWAEIAR